MVNQNCIILPAASSCDGDIVLHDIPMNESRPAMAQNVGEDESIFTIPINDGQTVENRTYDDNQWADMSVLEKSADPIMINHQRFVSSVSNPAKLGEIDLLYESPAHDIPNDKWQSEMILIAAKHHSICTIPIGDVQIVENPTFEDRPKNTKMERTSPESKIINVQEIMSIENSPAKLSEINMWYESPLQLYGRPYEYKNREMKVSPGKKILITIKTNLKKMRNKANKHSDCMWKLLCLALLIVIIVLVIERRRPIQNLYAIYE